MSQLWRHGLTPGFELMGNPGNLWTDFASDEQVCVILFVRLQHFCLPQVTRWHSLVTQVASRYLARSYLDRVPA